MTEDKNFINAFHSAPPPDWALRQHKSILQRGWDFVGAPLRMVVLPDHQSERLRLTSLRAERLRVTLPELQGRVLDVGCGDNMLLRLYRQRKPSDAAKVSVGADVFPWSSDILQITNSATLPFPDGSFDTISYLACLNHIPERADALKEANRLLRPGGRVIATMIESFVGKIGHALWWYSEDKERKMHPDELMGLDVSEMKALLRHAGLTVTKHQKFGYGLNNLFVAEKPLS